MYARVHAEGLYGHCMGVCIDVCIDMCIGMFRCSRRS